jgi:hypothetical protein
LYATGAARATTTSLGERARLPVARAVRRRAFDDDGRSIDFFELPPRTYDMVSAPRPG